MITCFQITFSVQPQSKSFLLFKSKHFHFIDKKVFISCQKCVSILTCWALVGVVQVDIAIFGVWCTGHMKIMVTSKGWPITTVAIDSPVFLSSLRWYLCWWQTAWVDKTEQEWTWCSFVISRTWGIPETLSLIMTLEPNSQNYHRPLQKRERTGKEYGCFPFVWKTKIFKWKINYILESLPRIEVFGGGKWQNGSSTNITQNRAFVWIG